MHLTQPNQYVSVKFEVRKFCTISTRVLFISECGGLFKVRSLSFTSPGYPNNYANDLYCEWFLEVEDNHRLSLRFDDFSTEDSCQHDSVKVRISTRIEIPFK